MDKIKKETDLDTKKYLCLILDELKQKSSVKKAIESALKQIKVKSTANAFLFNSQECIIIKHQLNTFHGRHTKKIKNSGGDAIFAQADVSIEEQAKSIVEKTIEAYGKIDILFNNAGIVLGGTLDIMSTEDWDRTMAVNVRGIYLVSKFIQLQKVRYYQ